MFEKRRPWLSRQIPMKHHPGEGGELRLLNRALAGLEQDWKRTLLS